MIVCRDGLLRHIRLITEISCDYVRSWINDELAPKGALNGHYITLGHKNAKLQLQKLAPLVADLQAITAPGETLVLCPTQELHRLPLHAIAVGGHALIERNPVGYFQSLTLLRLCPISLVTEPKKKKKRKKFEDSATVESISKLGRILRRLLSAENRSQKIYFANTAPAQTLFTLLGILISTRKMPSAKNSF